MVIETAEMSALLLKDANEKEYENIELKNKLREQKYSYEIELRVLRETEEAKR